MDIYESINNGFKKKYHLDEATPGNINSNNLNLKYYELIDESNKKIKNSNSWRYLEKYFPLAALHINKIMLQRLPFEIKTQKELKEVIENRNKNIKAAILKANDIIDNSIDELKEFINTGFGR